MTKPKSFIAAPLDLLTPEIIPQAGLARGQSEPITRSVERLDSQKLSES